MSSALTNGAAYALAADLVHLRFRAEVVWCSEEVTEHHFATVDVRVGRALQSLDALLAPAEVAGACAAACRLRDAIQGAGDAFQQAWQGAQFQTVLECQKRWRKTEADDDCQKRSYAIERSPLVGCAWQELGQATAGLRAALADDLRACFDLSSLLAGELYPTEEYRLRVEGLGVSHLRYLTVELDRRLAQAVEALSTSFPGLIGLDLDLSGETETSAMDKIFLLHQAIPPRLAPPPPPPPAPPEAGGRPAACHTEPAAGGPAAVLTFEPGAFVYRGQMQPLGGKPLQVLQALAGARWQTLTLKEMQDTIWAGSVIGDEAIRSAVKAARAALRAAMAAAGEAGPEDPIPTADRGTNRTAWRLDLH